MREGEIPQLRMGFTRFEHLVAPQLIPKTWAQGVALAQSDASRMTLVGSCTVSTDVKRYQ
jgi:hypothetical protein